MHRQPGLFIEDRLQKDVGIHQALHKKIRFSPPDQLHRLIARLGHISSLHQSGIAKGDVLLLHDTPDDGKITDKHGADHPGFLGGRHRLNGVRILRRCPRQYHWLTMLCLFQHLFKRNDHISFLPVFFGLTPQGRCFPLLL